MRTNGRRPAGSEATCALALLALTIGTALAAVPSTTALAAIPSTTAYHFSSHPMISGTVVTVNDHRMVVNTDQGEQVALEVDTRTMAPRDLGPGMVIRTEFLALEDCRLYAQRITPLRSDMSASRMQAYANTRDSRDTETRNASASDRHRWKHDGSPAVSESRETLPQTVGEHSPGTTMTATPASADYQFSTRPMISGRVVTVNDHRLVVETDQGRQVGLAMDSRTMVPGQIEPGSIVRTEFTPMRDGRYYANRVSWIGSGVVDREQTYAHTRDSDFLMAQNASDCASMGAATRNTVTSADEHREDALKRDAVVAQDTPAPAVERPATLPQTASHQPLMLLLGLFALGTAGLVTAVRGRRIV